MQWSKGVLEWADISVEKLGTSLDHVAFTIVHFLPVAFSWPDFNPAPLFPAGPYTLHAHNPEQGRKNVDRAQSLRRCPPFLISFSRELADHNGTPSWKTPLVTSPGRPASPPKFCLPLLAKSKGLSWKRNPLFRLILRHLQIPIVIASLPIPVVFSSIRLPLGKSGFAFVWHQVSSLNLTSSKEKRKGEKKMASMGPFQSMTYGDPNFSGSVSNVKRKKAMCSAQSWIKQFFIQSSQVNLLYHSLEMLQCLYSLDFGKMVHYFIMQRKMGWLLFPLSSGAEGSGPCECQLESTGRVGFGTLSEADAGALFLNRPQLIFGCALLIFDIQVTSFLFW